MTFSSKKDEEEEINEREIREKVRVKYNLHEKRNELYSVEYNKLHENYFHIRVSILFCKNASVIR